MDDMLKKDICTEVDNAISELNKLDSSIVNGCQNPREYGEYAN